MPVQLAQHCLPGLTLDDYVNEAIQFIQEHEPCGGGYSVGFSGGKDSIVTLDLVRRAGVAFHAFYNVTGIDHPEVVRFIRKNYPEVEFIHPKRTFWKLFKRKGPPLRIARWCCQHLKETTNFDHMMLGIRAEESPKRAARGRVNVNKNRKNSTFYLPIFHFQEWTVWEYIQSRNLPYPSLYDTGEHRIGCIGCPYGLCGSSPAKQKQREKEMARYPAFFKLHKKMAKEWFERTQPGWRERHPDKVSKTFEQWYHDYWIT